MKDGKMVLNAEATQTKEGYRNPVIPEGFIHLTGDWKEGFVIQNTKDSSEFVWIPVGYLDADSTLDGKTFNERFGEFYYWASIREDRAKKGPHEEIDQAMFQSVQKYGGYYVSRTYASKSEEGKAVIKLGVEPWVNITYPEAEAAASDYAKESKDVVSIIRSRASYDSMLRWIVKSGAKSKEAVYEYAASYLNIDDNPNFPKKPLPTGSSEEWNICNIYDVAGLINEWTSEKYGNNPKWRGAVLVNDEEAPADSGLSEEDSDPLVGFRIILYIK